MIETAATIFSNLGWIALAVLLYAAVGWLWFQPGTRIGLLGGDSESATLSRIAIYPLLGWMVLLIGVNWLRILAVPFRVSAPWLLVVVVGFPACFRLWRFLRLRSVPGFAGGLRIRGKAAGMIALSLAIFAIVVVNRMTIPSLDDIGVWGYDQASYIHIADQYLNHGMLEKDDVVSKEILGPWVALNSTVIRNFFTADPFQPAVYFSKPGAIFPIRWVGLIMRNGGAALDASMARWLGLDGVQAYVLSTLTQYLLLALAGIWLGLQLGLRLRWGLLIGAFASLWPIAVLPTVVDNRDQTLALVIVLVLLSSVYAGVLNFWIRGVILAALAVTYIEIFPVAMFTWALLHLDRKESWWAAVKALWSEGLVGLGCCFIYVPWAVNYLGAQLGNAKAMKFIFLSEGQLGPFSSFAGSFAGMDFTGHPIVAVLAVSAGGAMIALQLFGIFLWIRQGRYFGVGAFLVLAGMAAFLEHRDLTYSEYKFFTVIFPFNILFLATACRFFWEVRGADLSLASRRLRWLVAVLLILCVPAIGLGAGMRSEFAAEIFRARGVNSVLIDQQKMHLSDGLHRRSNDILQAYAISKKIGPQAHVLFTNFTFFDNAYFMHFLGYRPVKITNGLAFNQWEPHLGVLPFPSQSFLAAGDPVDEVVANCGVPNDPAHPDPMEDFIVLGGKIHHVESGRSFACFRVTPGDDVTLVQRLYSQVLPESKAEAPGSFTIGPWGMALAVYTLNDRNRPEALQFEIKPLVPSHAGMFWKRMSALGVYVNRKEEKAWTMRPIGLGVRMTIPVSPSPAGNIVEIGPQAHLPFKPFVIYRCDPNLITTEATATVISNFALEESPK